MLDSPENTPVHEKSSNKLFHIPQYHPIKEQKGNNTHKWKFDGFKFPSVLPEDNPIIISTHVRKNKSLEKKKLELKDVF